MVNEDYIRGFFDGDGCVHLHRGERGLVPVVHLSNSSLGLLEKIAQWLKAKDFHPHVKVARRTPGKGKEVYYYLALQRWQEIIRFGKEIGTEMPEKAVIFQEIELANDLRLRRFPRGGKGATVRAVEQMLKHSERMV